MDALVYALGRLRLREGHRGESQHRGHGAVVGLDEGWEPVGGFGVLSRCLLEGEQAELLGFGAGQVIRPGLLHPLKGFYFTPDKAVGGHDIRQVAEVFATEAAVAEGQLSVELGQPNPVVGDGLVVG